MIGKESLPKPYMVWLLKVNIFKGIAPTGVEFGECVHKNKSQSTYVMEIYVLPLERGVKLPMSCPELNVAVFNAM